MFKVIRSNDINILIHLYEQVRDDSFVRVNRSLKASSDVMETFGQLNTRMDALVSNVNEVIQNIKVWDVNARAREDKLQELLTQHIEIATLRLGLEHNDLGAYTSLRKGLVHMLNRIPTVNGKDNRPQKDYEALNRHLKAILRELDVLETQARIDEIIVGLIKMGLPNSGSPG